MSFYSSGYLFFNLDHSFSPAFSESSAREQDNGQRFAVWGFGILPFDASPAIDRAQGGHDQAISFGRQGFALPTATPSGNLHLERICDQWLCIVQVQGIRLGWESGLAY